MPGVKPGAGFEASCSLRGSRRPRGQASPRDEDATFVIGAGAWPRREARGQAAR